MQKISKFTLGNMLIKGNLCLETNWCDDDMEVSPGKRSKLGPIIWSVMPFKWCHQFDWIILLHWNILWLFLFATSSRQNRKETSCDGLFGSLYNISVWVILFTLNKFAIFLPFPYGNFRVWKIKCWLHLYSRSVSSEITEQRRTRILHHVRHC